MVEAVAVQRCKADKLSEWELSDCQRLNIVTCNRVAGQGWGERESKGETTNQPSRAGPK